MIKKTKNSYVQRILRFFLWCAAGAVALVLAVILLFRFVNPPTSAFMLGYQLSDEKPALQHEWVPLSDVSEWMALAVMASEDQRFLEHHGVDFQAVHKAVSEYQAGEGLRGASTITQQTAKNLFLWNGRSFVRKTIEAGLALTIDALWPKRRILEVYLNIAEFGRGVYGVQAASRAYYGIPAGVLSARQAAQLAAVLPNPKVLSVSAPSPYVQERVAWIQRQMGQLSRWGYLDAL
ncbi:monofunctional biosynthetic peptidoglycan transglycosylase [Marinobacter sp. MDS2]|uniref:monofunctional biosynthetic peptidoglycan transglycosylase n=1 Tax=Marinobacter sp. MDS2 TaxID=3065961 RepID=UPI00273CAEE4|nr:monofunctional biosynthetic peptidoglycan transglycosylase [Marinobacter sp. MDS2]MDP4547139.1 monofunctional biosynthetic peptidoglycan transglycosylase [Marinobacter sp. MDS2]